MAGKATLTTNVSIISIPRPRHAAISVSHFEALSGPRKTILAREPVPLPIAAMANVLSRPKLDFM